MKCEMCSQPATVHLTEIKQGEKHEIHLCEECAQKKGVSGKAHFSISDLLAGITSSQKAVEEEKPQGAKCPTCGITLAQFQSSGRFGCADCYVTFREDIMPLVEKIHDSSQHIGKVPSRVSREVTIQKEIRNLQLELKKVVRQEDYEQAAALRDQIKKLEQQLERKTELEGDAEDAENPKKRRSVRRKKTDEK